MTTEVSTSGITFEKFLLLNYKYLRAGPESFDRMIFEIFDLNYTELIGETELCKMLLTLPP
jgi:Ca2+-binding EF-hand superfamily protein